MKIPISIPWIATGKTLGRGGQGDVHVVTRKGEPEDKKYALKVLRNTGSFQAHQRFQREIKTIRKLNNLVDKSCDSAIVRIIDHSDQDDKFQFYVMEYYEEAETLSNIIFSPSNPYYGNALKSLGLFERIVAALGEYESSDLQIVHRDINPKNILVLPDDTVRLIDFGICQYEDGELITMADEGVGARNYTAPECESGIEESIGIHSDIYSASKVLWSAITSRKAFAFQEAAFGNQSMVKMFPKRTETWHLTRLYAKSIRRSAGDRFQRTRDVLYLIRELRYLIQRGFPPLEDSRKRCIRCGGMCLIEFPESHLVFGNPNPPGIVAIQCDTCGFIYLQNKDVWKVNFDKVSQLS